MPFGIRPLRRVDEGSLRRFAGVLSFILISSFVFVPCARPQQPPPGAIGRVEGFDVSVEGGTPGAPGNSTTAPSIYVSSGSIVTVHSGKAQLTLAAGGMLNICGPAKFALLQSGDAVTVALSFGRMHVELPASTALRLFTPTVIATPLDINGAARDVTVGLDVHDSLCVLASSGALRLEHQFSGENLVVPQAGEFFLEGGRLSPVVGQPGTCECQVARAQVAVPPPPIPGPSAKPPTLAPMIAVDAQPPTSKASADKGADSSKPETAPAPGLSVEFSVLAHANETHPVRPGGAAAVSPAAGANKPAQDLAPAPEYRPEYKVMIPPLSFSANSPTPPPGPDLDTILLVRIARVQPAWEFTGKVEAPQLNAKSKQPASGAAAASSAQSQPQPARDAKPAKSGFWARLKHIFGGGTVEAAPKPCQGTGCH